ncbi:hypothetical protein [Nocardia arizonensis]|uniref:hypothetical protein n=1 Tax=Nocardia arizonensis TaxID=1141647 RepID=UPI0006D296E7|nr:hypothetical protein [Nocardia arizonensis]
MTATDDDAAQQLLEDYHRAGGNGQTIPDISRQPYSTPEIITVLSGWLSDLESRWPGPETEGRELTRLVLANALGRKEARRSVAVPALISQFDTTKPVSSRARWAAGNALCDIPAEPSYFDQLAEIATNREFGDDRQMVISWLAKSRSPAAATVAISQLDDETVCGHVLDALARLRAQGVREQIEPFLTSKNKWYKRSAERIIRYDQS